MESEAQKGTANPSAMLASLLSRRAKLHEELRNIEKQAEEIAAGRDDGRSDFGPGRSKGGGIYANGQGKPKKGRGGPRDAKRIRASSEQDFDYEDDPDMTL